MTGQELKTMFGNNVKMRRQLKLLSQMKLAEAMDVSPNALSDIETGKKFVKADTLAALADGLGIGAYELFKPKHILPDDREGLVERISEAIRTTLAKFIDR